MGRDLADIELTFDNIIGTILSTRAHAASEFKTRGEDINEQIEETWLQNLSVAQDIKTFVSWATRLMIDDAKVIENYQQYVQAILENVQMREDMEEQLESRIEEHEQESDALKQKNSELRAEILKLQGKVQARGTIPAYQEPEPEEDEKLGKVPQDMEPKPDLSTRVLTIAEGKRSPDFTGPLIKRIYNEIVLGANTLPMLCKCITDVNAKTVTTQIYKLIRKGFIIPVVVEPSSTNSEEEKEDTGKEGED